MHVGWFFWNMYLHQNLHQRTKQVYCYILVRIIIFKKTTGHVSKASWNKNVTKEMANFVLD